MGEEHTKELFLKLEKIVEYYHKGLGNSIWGTNNDIEGFMHLDIYDERYVERFQNNIVPLLSHYESIPFDNLNGEKEFSPLFVINELLLRYYFGANKLFDEPDQKIKDNLLGFGKSIINLGHLYQKSLDETLFEIRKDPKHRYFDLKIFDDKGDVFYL